jgi:hypothetical protein
VAFLAGVRAGRDRETVGGLADTIATQAKAWNAAAYAAYHDSSGDQMKTFASSRSERKFSNTSGSTSPVHSMDHATAA